MPAHGYSPTVPSGGPPPDPARKVATRTRHAAFVSDIEYPVRPFRIARTSAASPRQPARSDEPGKPGHTGLGFLRVPQLAVSPGGPLPDSPEPELRAIAA